MPQLLAQLALASLLALLWVAAIKDCFVHAEEDATSIKNVVFAILFSLFIGLVASAGAFDRLPDFAAALKQVMLNPEPA